MRLTQKQKLTLVFLALSNCLVIAGLGSIVVTQTLKANTRTVASVVPGAPAASASVVIPTDRPAPPTWTPAASPTPPGMDLLYTFAPERCMFAVPDGARVTCGYAVLPEARGDPPAGLIRLAVAVYHSFLDTPAPDPVVYLSGGPGGAALDSTANIYDTFLVPLLRERDVIVFDQRGVGLSQPALECRDYVAVVEKDLEQRFTAEQKAYEYPLAISRCRDRLTLRGIDLAAYTSAANASDVRDLVALLGYEQVDLYGVSYGTRLALTIMRDHPEIVRSAVLDSVEPIEEPMFNRQAGSATRVLRKLFDGCAADADCRARYPNLENVFYTLLDRLDAEPATIWARSVGEKMYKIQLTGDLLVGGIFFASYSHTAIAYLPRMIYDAAAGDYRLAEWIMGISVGAQSGLSFGMNLSVNCHEEVFATTPEEIIADFAVYPHTAGYAYEAVFGDPYTLFSVCQAWGAAPFDPLEGLPVASDIPALIFGGEYDPITPPDYGRQVAAQLSRSYFYEFSGQGHGFSMWESSCAQTMALVFLRDPLVAPDGLCSVDVSNLNFIK